MRSRRNLPSAFFPPTVTLGKSERRSAGGAFNCSVSVSLERSGPTEGSVERQQTAVEAHRQVHSAASRGSTVRPTSESKIQCVLQRALCLRLGQTKQDLLDPPIFPTIHRCKCFSCKEVKKKPTKPNRPAMHFH